MSVLLCIMTVIFEEVKGLYTYIHHCQKDYTVCVCVCVCVCVSVQSIVCSPFYFVYLKSIMPSCVPTHSDDLEESRLCIVIYIQTQLHRTFIIHRMPRHYIYRSCTPIFHFTCHYQSLIAYTSTSTVHC